MLMCCKFHLTKSDLEESSVGLWPKLTFAGLTLVWGFDFFGFEALGF